MLLLPTIREVLAARQYHGVCDDFYWYVSPHQWTSLLTTTGAAAAISTASGLTAGGWLKLTTTTSTANGESGVIGTNKTFLFAADKPMLFETRVNTAEANTSNLGLFAGFSSALAAGQLVDTTGGLVAAGGSWAGFYKDLNSQNIYVACSIGTTPQKATKTSSTIAATSTTTTFGVEVNPVADIKNVEMTYFINGVQALDATSLKPIKHNLDCTSAVTMFAGVYSKGFSTTAELTYVDYIAAAQLR